MHLPADHTSSRAQQPPRWEKLLRAVRYVRETLKDLAKLEYRDPDLYFSWNEYRDAYIRTGGELDFAIGPHGTPPPDWYIARDTDHRPSEAITIGDLTCEGHSISTDGILWIGRGPPPDFEDPAFWIIKAGELAKKVRQLKPPGLKTIQNAILHVSSRLQRLSRLGRTGQWILHNQDLYEASIDTQPGSRKSNEIFPLRGLKYKGVLIDDHGIFWAGKGQRPDFEDPAYWVSKVEELDAKIQQVKDGHVRPEFTPAELRTLESMERQEGHCFHRIMMDRKDSLQQRKDRVFIALRELALLGRPGQWVLHHEELYDPDIDTRPQTRQPDEDIRIGGFTYKGEPIPNQLFWAGKEQPPDVEDLVYWERKEDELVGKVRQVKDGKVQDRFTPEEVVVLESMERDEDHQFCEAEKQRREKEERRDGDEGEITPSSQAAAERMKEARKCVWEELINLEDDLPGMWVLRQQAIYLPEHNIPRPDDETTMAIPPIRNGACLGVVDTSYGLRYAGDFPPDFDDIRYWESKLQELRAKKEEVKAGRVEHRFSKVEQLQLSASERETLGTKSATRKMTDRVNAWIPDPDAAETDVSQATWSSRPSSRSASVSRVCSSAAATQNPSSAECSKRQLGRDGGLTDGFQRKRPADDEEALPTARPGKRRGILRSVPSPASEDRLGPPSTRLAKHKRSEPAHEMRLRSPPATIAVAGLSKTGSGADVTTEAGQERRPGKRKRAQKPTAPASRSFSRWLRDPSPRKKETTTRSRAGGAGTQPRKQPVPSSQPAPRRSARIAALPPKKYR